ncbi:MAG: hypothetical protein DBX66_09005 [Clostridiales bacterium]|uniref:hypothetical protein n=1 Tax=Provencibacterium massiliense TaxID=1841868 RepID=UPI0009A726CD|nr:hypothetical protein [Provencibacterium massiliense]PWM35016.1 MAG: hypothetical protein DBX66_09005 [Clostridiales bacterium]RGB68664.1 hypothetical protein DW086_02735 [Harryflintia acetispora]
MKKALLLLLAGVLVACTGCAHTAAKEPKACKVEVYSDGGELLKTIDDQETIELLTPTEDWADAEAPQPEPAAQYELVVWQEKTLLAGEDPEGEREYEVILNLTLYRDSPLVKAVISPQAVKNMRLTEEMLTAYYTLPDETLSALRQAVG